MSEIERQPVPPDVLDADLTRVVPLDQLDDFKVAEGDPDVRGWEVVASDGRRIGEVDQLLVDIATMKVRYLDVDLDDSLASGRHVLIPIGYARLEEGNDRVLVSSLASEDVVGLPEYIHGPITRNFESVLRTRLDSAFRAGAANKAEHTDLESLYSRDLYEDSYFHGPRRNLEGRKERLTLSEEDVANLYMGEMEREVLMDEEAVVEKRAVPKEEFVVRKHELLMQEEVVMEARRIYTGEMERDVLMDEETVVEKRAVPKEEFVVRKHEVADTEMAEAGGARAPRRRNTMSESGVSASGGPTDGGRGDDPGREPPPSRYIQARMPTRARINEGVPLLARIALAPGPDASTELASFSVPLEGAEVEIAVRSATLQFLSPTSRAVRVLPDAGSEWVMFEFRGQVEAVHDLQVLAYRGGALLGVLHMEITVDMLGRTGTMTDWSEPADFREPEAGEVTWEVRFDRASGCYRYQLHGSAFGWTDEIRTDQLLRPPEQAVSDFVARLNAQARNLTQYTDRETREWLRGQGSDLWNEMIPKEFERFFWEHREKITRLTILSPGDPMPWEALYPGSDSGEDAGFLAEQFTVTRWVYGPPASRLVHFSAPYFVVPDGSPSTAASEVEALQRVVGGTRVQGLTPLLDLLRAGQFDLLHFACHNRFVPESPSSSYIEMDGRKHFEISLVPRRRPWQKRSPVVFMNACRSDAQGANYTRLDGWAQRFLGAGAGAFIGSLWEVRDRTASRFAEAFYGALHGRKELGEAMREGREAIRAEPGDPTWLAYTLYGDPTATLARE